MFLVFLVTVFGVIILILTQYIIEFVHSSLSFDKNINKAIKMQNGSDGLSK